MNLAMVTAIKAHKNCMGPSEFGYEPGPGERKIFSVFYKWYKRLTSSQLAVRAPSEFDIG